MRTLSNPKTGRESPDTVSHVPECSQNQDLAFISKKIQLVSLISKTLEIYYLEKKQENEKYITGSSILTEVEVAQPETSLSELQTRFEQLAQRKRRGTPAKTTDLWGAYQTARENLTALRNQTRDDSHNSDTDIRTTNSRESSSTRSSNATPPPEKEVIERATYYPVYLSRLLSDTDRTTMKSGSFKPIDSSSFMQALEFRTKHLEIEPPFEDPIQSREDLMTLIAHIKTTYEEMKSDNEKECNGIKIDELNQLIIILEDDLKRLKNFSQHNPGHSTPERLELTSTESIKTKINQIKQERVFYKSTTMRESVISTQYQFHETDSISVLNKLIEHPILTALHRWTHPDNIFDKKISPKKSPTDHLIREIEGLNGSEIEKKAIKKVIAFHVCKFTMDRITDIKQHRKRSNQIINQFDKIQGKDLFRTALDDQSRIMRAMNENFDQQQWLIKVLNSVIQSADEMGHSDKTNLRKIESYITHFQLYSNIMSYIEETQERKLPPLEGLSKIQEEFYSAINLEAQSQIENSIDLLNEAIKKPDTDENECFLSSVSELQTTLSKLELKYRISVPNGHCDLIKTINHLEIFKKDRTIPEDPEGKLQIFFEIYKGIQLRKEKKELTTMINQVAGKLNSIKEEIADLLSPLATQVIPKNQPYYCMWETKNPLHTAATELKEDVRTAIQSLTVVNEELMQNQASLDDLQTSLDKLKKKKQAIAKIGTTLVSNIKRPEITTPLQATCFERIIKSLKMFCSAFCAWFTGSCSDDDHSTPKTRLSQKRDDIMGIYNNPGNTLFSRSASHHTQVTGSPTPYGYKPLPTG